MYNPFDMQKIKIQNYLWFALVLLLIAGTFWFIKFPKQKLDRAESDADEYFTAEVVAVVNEEVETVIGTFQPAQKVDVEIKSGGERGEIVQIEQGQSVPLRQNQKVEVGDRVVVTKTYGGARDFTYYINEPYRLPGVALIALIFFAFAVFFAREKGFKSILGLAFSIFILVNFIIPKIAQGANPFPTILIGTFVIAFISLYLAHGFNKMTSIALLGTLLTLVIAAFLSAAFVSFAKLSGISTEEASYLQMNMEFLNFRGLLLGGIILGALGVLDDVTVSQVATVGEIRNANPRLSFHDLYKRGLVVGREHIASLINTLALAYAGAALPILFLFKIDEKLPLWISLNNEFVVEEVIRTLVGSTSLIFAVPISTFLAAYFLKGGEKHKHAGHVHSGQNLG